MLPLRALDRREVHDEAVDAVGEPLVAVRLEERMPVLGGDLAREQEGPVHVDCHDELEVVIRLLGDAGVPGHAGGVDDAVDASVGFEGRCDRLLHVRFVGHVGGDDQGLDGCVAGDRGTRLLEPGGVEIHHRDVGAVASQHVGDRVPDPLGGAGHDVGLAEEGVLTKDGLHDRGLLERVGDEGARCGRRPRIAGWRRASMPRRRDQWNAAWEVQTSRRVLSRPASRRGDAAR